MIVCRDSRLAFEFLNQELILAACSDFVGQLFIPEEFRNEPARFEHVGLAVGYSGFNGRVCVMHTVIQRRECMTKGVLREVFALPFIERDCVAVLALVDGDNTAALDLDLRLGFREVDRIADGAAEGVALHVLRMDRARCHWIRKPARSRACGKEVVHHGQAKAEEG